MLIVRLTKLKYKYESTKRLLYAFPNKSQD